jgi:hypothetical protein
MAIDLTAVGKTIVKNFSLITQENDPQLKVTPVGFLQMLLENPTTTQISNLREIQNGHETVLKFRYLKRGVESEVTDRDDCETPLKPIWGAAEITRPFFSKIGLSITNDELRQWEALGSSQITPGTPAARMSLALYTSLVVRVNGLLQKMDSNLLSQQATNWGKNVVSGNANAQIVNFANSPVMGDGIVKLMRDFQINEQAGAPLIVGNGKAFDYNLLQGLKHAADNLGFGSNPTYKAYEDLRSIGIWGENHFGVFAKGSVGFVDFNKHVGGFANDTGNSVEFLLPVPVEIAKGVYSSLLFDAQLLYNECNKYDEDGTLIAAKGWGIVLSKSYGLFNAPTDTYQAADRLYEVNGSFHYLGA